MGRTSGSTSSTDHPERVLVGRVVGAHGLRGQVRVRCLAEGPETLLAADEFWLGCGDAAPERHAVCSAAPGRSGELRVSLEGVDDRDAAEALRGSEVWAAPEALEPLAEGEYYGYQLLGCLLEGEDGTRVGTVRDLWRTGAPDVLVVVGDDGREVLIPAALLRRVDVEARRAVVELVPGLLDVPDATDGE